MTVNTFLDGGLIVFWGEDIVNLSTFKYAIMFILSQEVCCWSQSPVDNLEAILRAEVHPLITSVS